MSVCILTQKLACLISRLQHSCMAHSHLHVPMSTLVCSALHLFHLCLCTNESATPFQLIWAGMPALLPMFQLPRAHQHETMLACSSLHQPAYAHMHLLCTSAAPPDLCLTSPFAAHTFLCRQAWSPSSSAVGLCSCQWPTWLSWPRATLA